MKYLLMVGHGQFPPGLHDALTMFASDTPDLMYCNLENGMDTDKYVENLKKKLEVIDPQKDEIIILSDLPGGSPLTNVIAVLGEMEMLEHCVIYTGMNLPLAINVVMTKDSTTLDKLDELVLADTQAKRFVLDPSATKETVFAGQDVVSMAISFIRIDDRIIHGQTVTRWANEYPCTGLIGVNDAAAGNKLLVSAFKGASSKKTFVWNKEHFKKNADKVLTSKDQYFLITKNSVDMAELLVDFKFATPIKKVIVGPCPDRPGAVKLGNNQSITQDEAEAFERMYQAGFEIEFALVKEASIGTWEKFRGKFGY